MNYKIAIASHQRIDMIRNKTLFYLNKHKINPTSVYIFVSPESYESYKEHFEPLKYNIINSKNNILDTRNHIIQYFDEGEPIIEIDDDLEDIHITKKGVENERLGDLNNFIINSFEKLGEKGLWGINSNVNNFFAMGEDKFGLYSIVNSFLGYYNDKDIILGVPEKEDFDRVCQFFIKKSPILKRCGYGVKTRYWKNQGGIQARYNFEHRIIIQKESADILMEKYPELVYPVIRKNGIVDIRFRRGKKIYDYING